jgi:hypothetical protein
MKKLLYVRWRDAMMSMELEPGPEIDGTATMQAGRWRLHA